jgi:hypothetical protein
MYLLPYHIQTDPGTLHLLREYREFSQAVMCTRMYNLSVQPQEQ